MSQSIPEGNAFFFTAYFVANADRLQLAQFLDPQAREPQATIPRGHELSARDIEGHLTRGFVRVDGGSARSLPESLTQFNMLHYIRQFECESAVFIPVMQGADMRGLVMIGARAGQVIGDEVINSFQRTIQLTTKVVAKPTTPSQPVERERRSLETRALNILAANTATISDLKTLYSSIHDQFRSVIGDHGFVIALYDESTNSISIPYLYEEGQFSSLDTFPLGEGLTSILIRTREPLMVVSDTEKRIIAMGAKISGKPPRSWMGVPLLVRGEAIGALIVQDLEKEFSFDEEDLRFAIAVASQISGAIYNVRLLHDSQQVVLQFETAAEIARDISSSLDLDELLQKAVDLIRARFDFYHASVFLKDMPGEFVVIRGSTGDAGAQLKRTSHKLGVGSKSIVGFVAGKGESLVVNDTTRDATYYPNPVLPDTRAEAAIPLKVADRILGVLDVQSDRAYAFTSDNLRILQILADQLAIAVINTELFSETQEHLAQHRLLHHITTTAASGTTLDEALSSAVNGLQVTLGGDRVTILLLNKEKNTLEVKAAVGYADEIFKQSITLGSGITGWSALHRKPLRVANARQDSRYIEGSPNTQSELAIPLLYRGELLGV
ncbi:MAG TPA: GAF domain-containing protein, partial [Anaerolineales bacterium]|nr:GAF domain-containing protein [Anaerolineales bacterium]